MSTTTTTTHAFRVTDEDVQQRFDWETGAEYLSVAVSVPRDKYADIGRMKELRLWMAAVIDEKTDALGWDRTLLRFEVEDYAYSRFVLLSAKTVVSR